MIAFGWTVVGLLWGLWTYGIWWGTRPASAVRLASMTAQDRRSIVIFAMVMGAILIMATLLLIGSPRVAAITVAVLLWAVWGRALWLTLRPQAGLPVRKTLRDKLRLLAFNIPAGAFLVGYTNLVIVPAESRPTQIGLLPAGVYRWFLLGSFVLGVLLWVASHTVSRLAVRRMRLDDAALGVLLPPYPVSPAIAAGGWAFASLLVTFGAIAAGMKVWVDHVSAHPELYRSVADVQPGVWWWTAAVAVALAVAAVLARWQWNRQTFARAVYGSQVNASIHHTAQLDPS